MKVMIFDSVDPFLRRVEGFLEQKEAENNLLLGLLYTEQQKELKGEARTDTLMGVVEDANGNLALVIFRNHINLILCGNEETDIEGAVSVLISYLHKSGIELQGVVGATEITTLFANNWASHNNLTPYVKMNQMIYRLDQVNPVKYSPGKLVLATLEELELAADWIYKFCEEIDEPIEREEALKRAKNNIETSSFYLWQDDVFVSMVKKSRPTRNGIVLTLVYTPPELRGKGYASSSVASLSQLLLDEGYRFCSLYTDLSNPTSNRIYSNIGYLPVQDSILYRFR